MPNGCYFVPGVGEAQEQSGDGIPDEMQAGICSLYNIHYFANLSNFEQGLPSMQDGSDFPEFLFAVMDVRAHEHLFWSALHVQTVHELLASKMGNFMKEGEVVEGEAARSQRTTVFET